MTYNWTQITNSLPTAMNQRDGLGGAVLNGKMYALGGWKTGTGYGTTYNSVLYSTDGVTWTASAQPASWTGRHAFPVVVHNNRIYVIGGDQNSGTYQPDVHSWSGLETDPWIVETASAPWGNRAGQIAFSLGGYIWVGFGQTATNLTPAPSAFFTDLWRSTDGATWTLFKAKNVPSFRGYFSNNPPIIDDEAYFIGGGTYDTSDFPTREYKNDVYAMDVNGNFRLVNSGKPSALGKLMYHSLAEFDGKLWVIGGYAGSDQNKVYVSADKGETWTMSTGPFSSRHAALLINYNGALYFGTGMNAADMWKISPPPPPPVFGPKDHVGALPDGTTALASVYTIIDKEVDVLTPGVTVDKMGYWRNSSGSMTPKIFKQTGTSNTFQIVWIGTAQTHPGGGHYNFDIPDYVVPDDGSTYRIGFSLSYPSADMFAHSGSGRWLKAGNLTGTQTFNYYTDGSCPMTWTEV